jgi:Family of unknown function (DUF5330)
MRSHNLWRVPEPRIYPAVLRKAETARSTRGGEELNGTGEGVFFLIRMTFWLGLVLVLLPTGKTPDDDKLPKIGAGEAVSAAAAAVSDMSQFCVRQPAACEIGGEAATVIGHRAQAGARKIYRMISNTKSSDQTGSIDRHKTVAGIGEAKSQDTLNASDREIEWHGERAPAADSAPAPTAS